MATVWNWCHLAVHKSLCFFFFCAAPEWRQPKAQEDTFVMGPFPCWLLPHIPLPSMSLPHPETLLHSPAECKAPLWSQQSPLGACKLQQSVVGARSFHSNRVQHALTSATHRGASAAPFSCFTPLPNLNAAGCWDRQGNWGHLIVFRVGAPLVGCTMAYDLTLLQSTIAAK